MPESARDKSPRKDSPRPKKSAPGRRATGHDAAVERQAQQHSKIRQDHSQEISEDYVELIAQLIRQHGEARTVDIANRLGVSHVTVTKRISRLQRSGLVQSAPYRSIFLTTQGQDLAAKSEARHQLIVAFLHKLGVNPTDAETDAEGIEHHVSLATLDAIRRFVESPPTA